MWDYYIIIILLYETRRVPNIIKYEWIISAVYVQTYHYNNYLPNLTYQLRF